MNFETNELSINELDIVAGGCNHGFGGCKSGKADGLGALRAFEGAVVDGAAGIVKSVVGAIGNFFH
jgi:hypothetical protein